VLQDLAARHELGEGVSAAPLLGASDAHLLGRRLQASGKRDRVMRKLIPQLGEGRLESRGDAFTTLARSIVGQQISVKAAQSVWDRFARSRRANPRASTRRRCSRWTPRPCVRPACPHARSNT
jgi:hypothetical protein